MGVDFADFYDEHRLNLARLLCLTLNDDELGFEAANEAFTRAWQRWDQVSTLQNPPGWIVRVGMNWARTQQHRRTVFAEKVRLLDTGSTYEPRQRDIGVHQAMSQLQNSLSIASQGQLHG